MGGDGELIFLMREVSVSSDSLVLPSLVLGLTGLEAGFGLMEVFCFDLFSLVSVSLSDSVSINFLDLLTFVLDTGFAVADFLGTTLGFAGKAVFLADEACFFLAKLSLSCSSSVMGLGLALALVTNPDFFTTTGFFLFFSDDDGSFLLGLFTGLTYK